MELSIVFKGGWQQFHHLALHYIDTHTGFAREGDSGRAHLTVIFGAGITKKWYQFPVLEPHDCWERVGRIDYVGDALKAEDARKGYILLCVQIPEARRSEIEPLWIKLLKEWAQLGWFDVPANELAESARDRGHPALSEGKDWPLKRKKAIECMDLMAKGEFPLSDTKTTLSRNEQTIKRWKVTWKTMERYIREVKAERTHINSLE